MPEFCNAKLISLQQINSPFGFRQYLLRTLHFAKHYNELRASRFFRTPPTAVLRMNDWIARLDAIIQLNGRDLLTHAGRISHQMALEKSAQEYDKYRDAQRQIQHDESLKELEHDIQQLQKSVRRNIKDGVGKIEVVTAKKLPKSENP